MKRKVLSLVLATAMTTLMMTGCGSSNGAAANAGGDSASAGGNKLTVAAWDANFNIPALKAAAEAYKTVKPDFELEIIEQSQSSDIENAITTAAQSGNYSNLADIVLFQDHYIQQYVTNYPDAWQSLDGANINWDDFGAEKISYSTINGVHYGAPVDNGTAVFAYRTDLLEQCGYTIDDVTGITWDRFIEIGKEVYDKSGKYLLCMDGDGNDLPYMLMQAEGQSQFKDGVPNLQNNETLKQILDVIERAQEANALILYQDWSAYTNGIQNDEVAGVMNGNWIIPTIEQVAENAGKWAITTLPTLSGAEGYAANGGSSLYITANCKNTDLAKDFLAYTFGGGEGAVATYDNALKDGGVITTCLSAGESSVYQEGVEYFGGQPIYADIVAMGGHVNVVEQSDYHYNTRTQVSAAITNIRNGASIEDALAEAQSLIDAEISH